MAGATWLQVDENWAVTANWGEFNGFGGFAATGALRIDPNVTINGGVGFSEDGKEWGGRVGIRFGGR
jgi:hypothetical protein